MSCKDSLKHIDQTIESGGAVSIVSNAVTVAEGNIIGISSSQLKEQPEVQPYAVAATMMGQIGLTLNKNPERLEELLPVGKIAQDALGMLLLLPSEAHPKFYEAEPLKSILGVTQDKITVDIGGKKVETDILDDSKAAFGCAGVITSAPSFDRVQPLASATDMMFRTRFGMFGNMNLFDDEENPQLNKTFADLVEKPIENTSADAADNDLLLHMLTPELVEGTLGDKLDLTKHLDRYLKLVDQVNNAKSIDFNTVVTATEHGTPADPLFQVFEAIKTQNEEGKSGDAVSEFGKRIFYLKGNDWETESRNAPGLRIKMKSYMVFNIKDPGKDYAEFSKIIDKQPPMIMYAMDESDKKDKEKVALNEVGYVRNAAMEGLMFVSGNTPDANESARLTERHSMAPRLAAKPQYSNYALPLTDNVAKGILMGTAETRTNLAKRLAPGIAKMLADSVMSNGQENVVIPSLTGPMAVFLMNPAFSTRLTTTNSEGKVSNVANYVEGGEKGGKVALGNTRLAEFYDLMANQLKTELAKELTDRKMPAEKAKRYAGLLSRNGFTFSTLGNYFIYGDPLLKSKDLADRLTNAFVPNAPSNQSNIHHI